MKLEIYNFLFLKLNRNFKQELSPSKPLLHSTQSPILRVGTHYFLSESIVCWLPFLLEKTTIFKARYCSKSASQHLGDISIPKISYISVAPAIQCVCRDEMKAIYFMAMHVQRSISCTDRQVFLFMGNFTVNNNKKFESQSFGFFV